LVLLTVLISISLAFSLASVWGVGLAVGFWIGAIAVLQRMGKADPLLRKVYMRHIRCRPFYPAKSALFSQCVPRPSRWR
jgi:type IV secretion system protein TrbD